jgi:hypothetical protein
MRDDEMRKLVLIAIFHALMVSGLMFAILWTLIK